MPQGDSGFFSDEEIDKLFDTPQARLQRQQAEARVAAAKAEIDRSNRERALRRISRDEATAKAAEFIAVANGAVPMVRSEPELRRIRNSLIGGTGTPPRPGGTGAISIDLAIATLKRHVADSDRPREAASSILATITEAIVSAADEADPIID